LKRKEDYTEEDERAIRNLATAMDNLRKAVGGKPGESAEAKYADAYNVCYRLGLKQYKLQVCKTTR
jgi:hypothetical protein